MREITIWEALNNPCIILLINKWVMLVLKYKTVNAAKVSNTAMMKGIFLPTNLVRMERMMTKGNPLKPYTEAENTISIRKLDRGDEGEMKMCSVDNCAICI